LGGYINITVVITDDSATMYNTFVLFQLNDFRALMNYKEGEVAHSGGNGPLVDNFRPVNPLNGRTVYSSFEFKGENTRDISKTNTKQTNLFGRVSFRLYVKYHGNTCTRLSAKLIWNKREVYFSIQSSVILDLQLWVVIASLSSNYNYKFLLHIITRLYYNYNNFFSRLSSNYIIQFKLHIKVHYNDLAWNWEILSSAIIEWVCLMFVNEGFYLVIIIRYYNT